MARENPTRTPTGFLTFFGGVVLLLIFAAIVMYWVRSNGSPDEVSTRRAQGRIATREQLTKKYSDQLGATGWTDKTKGVAHIPIAEAMKLSLVELKGKKVGASSVKVEAPLPVIPPDPKSTEPAPMVLPSAPSGAQTLHFDAFPTVAAANAGPPAPASQAALPTTSVPAAPAPGSSPAPASQPPAPAPAPPSQPPTTTAPPAAPTAPAPAPQPSAPNPPPPAAPPAPAADAPAKPAEAAPAPAPAPAKPAVNLVPALDSPTPPAPAPSAPPAPAAPSAPPAPAAPAAPQAAPEAAPAPANPPAAPAQ